MNFTDGMVLEEYLLRILLSELTNTHGTLYGLMQTNKTVYIRCVQCNTQVITGLILFIYDYVIECLSKRYWFCAEGKNMHAHGKQIYKKLKKNEYLFKYEVPIYSKRVI